GPPRGSAKLPYAGITRIRFEGTVSTGPRPVPPLQAALDHVAPPRASGAAVRLPGERIAGITEDTACGSGHGRDEWPGNHRGHGRFHQERARPLSSSPPAPRADAPPPIACECAQPGARPAAEGGTMPVIRPPEAGSIAASARGARA